MLDILSVCLSVCVSSTICQWILNNEKMVLSTRGWVQNFLLHPYKFSQYEGEKLYQVCASWPNCAVTVTKEGDRNMNFSCRFRCRRNSGSLHSGCFGGRPLRNWQNKGRTTTGTSTTSALDSKVVCVCVHRNKLLKLSTKQDKEVLRWFPGSVTIFCHSYTPYVY
jgi:hypothetical protein